MNFQSFETEAAFEQNALEIVDDMGFGWNLGNSLDAYVGTTFGCQDLASEICWGNPKTTQAFIDSVKPHFDILFFSVRGIAIKCGI